MSNDRKCEILDIDKKFVNFFLADQPKQKNLQIMKIFRINDLSKYTTILLTN